MERVEDEVCDRCGGEVGQEPIILEILSDPEDYLDGGEGHSEPVDESQGVPLVESKETLFVESLDTLPIGSIDWGSVRSV